MFSLSPTPRTITPVVYLYELVFGGSAIGATVSRVGVGAAVGGTLAILVILVSALVNLLFAERRLEY